MKSSFLPEDTLWERFLRGDAKENSESFPPGRKNYATKSTNKWKSFSFNFGSSLPDERENHQEPAKWIISSSAHQLLVWSGTNQ
jgi:hypothetical protein